MTKNNHPLTGVLYYYPYVGHSGQKIMIGKWCDLEIERKRLKQYGYKYERFKLRYK